MGIDLIAYLMILGTVLAIAYQFMGTALVIILVVGIAFAWWYGGLNVDHEEIKRMVDEEYEKRKRK